MSFKFNKIGRIIEPNPDIEWMSEFAGPSFARHREGDLFDIYVTGRDRHNRSRIGIVGIDINSPKDSLNFSKEAIFDLGDLAAFDENGVSYPYLSDYKGKTYMAYVGWMPTTISRFQNHTGLAYEASPGVFKRVSRAPILPRTDLEYSGTGSSCIFQEDGLFKMWYTSFIRWEKLDDEIRHYYVIRYAESTDAINWKRSEHICINFKNDLEFAISRPSVIKIGDKYHMWYAYRGVQYRIGYADSSDGINWVRKDDQAGITISEQGWDSQAVTYPHVFKHQNKIYMIHNGNEYGKTGLGLAVTEYPEK